MKMTMLVSVDVSASDRGSDMMLNSDAVPLKSFISLIWKKSNIVTNLDTSRCPPILMFIIEEVDV